MTTDFDLELEIVDRIPLAARLMLKKHEAWYALEEGDPAEPGALEDYLAAEELLFKLLLSDQQEEWVDTVLEHKLPGTGFATITEYETALVRQLDAQLAAEEEQDGGSNEATGS